MLQGRENAPAVPPCLILEHCIIALRIPLLQKYSELPQPAYPAWLPPSQALSKASTSLPLIIVQINSIWDYYIPLLSYCQFNGRSLSLKSYFY